MVPTKSEIEKIIAEITEEIIGDTPVSVQLNTAIDGMATEEEVRSLQLEVNALKKEVEKLIELIGDTSVSEQIDTAICASRNTIS